MDSAAAMDATATGVPSRPLHAVTPLLESRALSALLGSRVFLKMDNVQPSGSFKVRGVGHLCQKAKQAGATAFITSSGGNAGMAVAYCGRQLGVPVTVVIPQTTPAFMVDRLKAESASVIVHGAVWDEANQYALNLLKEQPRATYVPPFDHPDLWTGHASLVDEIAAQLPPGTSRPAAIVCSVGGGGLMNGVLEGLERQGWADVPTVAVETTGANCLAAALAAQRPVTLPAITSVAKSLGALTVSKRSLELATSRPVVSLLVTDRMAVDACTRFLEDHRALVEPACGASLAVAYEPALLSERLRGVGAGHADAVVVIVVCGGQAVTPALLAAWAQQLS